MGHSLTEPLIIQTPVWAGDKKWKWRQVMDIKEILPSYTSYDEDAFDRMQERVTELLENDNPLILND